MNIQSYRDLSVWQKSMELTVETYKLVKLLPKEEIYALSDQIRRAAVSIPSNIAEGASRTSPKEQLHFLEIAYGSLNEVMCQLELAKELDYIAQTQLKEIEEQYKAVAQMLSGLRKSKQIELAKH